MSTIDEIKARLDIVDTVTSYVSTLKRSGRTYKALCPFHNERTPSFAVDPERGTWHCFGACSTGGDVIEFIRRIENLEFPEALRVCAQRAGIELRPASQRELEEQEIHERLIRANEAAAVFFQASLDGPNASHAMTYLNDRGLDRDARERWQIGFAPDGWRTLLEHLQARGFSETDLLEAGLAVESREDGRSPYDRFRHRIMFPIRDSSDRLVGFGARSLSRDGGAEDDPKYLNTPQTPLFDKSGLLYGVSHAGESARHSDKMVVVEGYMDVIAAHQFGIENVVASMGTAVTDKQMNLVKRFTSNVVLALDADTAGSEATLRGVAVAAAAAEKETLPTIDWRGLVHYQDVLQADIRVITMPDGEDPDSLIRTNPDQFRLLLEESRPVTDHLFEVVSLATDLEDPRSRSQALETLTPTLSAIADPVVRAHYVQRLARLGKVDEQVVLALLNRGNVVRGPRAVPSVTEARRKTRKGTTSTPDGETQLLQLVLHRPEARETGLNLDPDTFEETINRNLFSAWCESEDLIARVNDLDNDIRERLESIIDSIPEALNPDLLEGRYVANMLDDIASELRDSRARERFRPAAVEQAERVVTARHEGASVLESANRAIREGSLHNDSDDDAVTLGIDFAQMTTRQRQLKRTSSTKTDHQDLNHGAEREEQNDDTDV